MTLFRGHLQGNVPMALTVLEEAGARFENALIRVIDSDDDPSVISRVVRRIGLNAEMTAGGVVIDWPSLLQAVERNFFNGFDEIWLFAGKPDPSAISVESRFTTDDEDVSEPPDDVVTGLLRQSGCETILADGCGLAFYTLSQRVASGLKAVMKPYS